MYRMPGSTTTRPRSAMNSPSPATSTGTSHQGRLKRSRKTSASSSAKYRPCSPRSAHELACILRVHGLGCGLAGAHSGGLEDRSDVDALQADEEAGIP